MKIIKNPRVRLLAATELDPLTYGTISKDTGWESDGENSPDILCEVSGRICYNSFSKPRPGGNKAYLDRIKEQMHGSVLEHANFTFLISDISRGCSHELVRHRAGCAISQRSTRYCDESESGVVLPYGINPGTLEYHSWVESCDKAFTTYRELVTFLSLSEGSPDTERRKRIRGLARSVLPTALATELVWTANARALRHFFEMRASRHAEWEIRRLATYLYDLVSDYQLFSDYQPEVLPDGTLELSTSWRKV